jgi:inositol-1,3,4-trisphosphate 5/6-kinase/inositol-tetrakisphosphate 1-kinase
MSLPNKRLGFWMSEKKSKKLSLSDIEEAFRIRNMETVKIDLNESLDSQGPFHGILHKLTDIIAMSDSGNKEAELLLAKFEEYVAENPGMVVMDPTDRIRTLLDRFKTYSAIQPCVFQTKETVFVPAFVVLESNKHNENIRLLRLSKVTFPLVCKPILAHGQGAHQMTLVFNESGLSECGFPCVVQSFVNHNAVMYKIFVIGDHSYLVERPSIKNLFPSDDALPIHFHSGDISKPDSSNRLTLQPDDELHNRMGDKIQLTNETVLSIAKSIRKTLGLNLFGVDFVIESATGRLAIIDINAFPGYDGVEEFVDRLADFVRSELDKADETSLARRDEFRTNGIETKDFDGNSAPNGESAVHLKNNY